MLETLAGSINTLWMTVTGGVDWSVPVQPLSNISWALPATFDCFWIFLTFALMNVMTAVFCQTAIEKAVAERDFASIEQLANKQSWCEEMRRVCVEIDANCSGQIELEEFEMALSDDRMRAFFESRGIEVSDVLTLFRLLDTDQRGCLELDDLVEGLLYLKGPARAMQLARVLQDGKELRHRLQELADLVEDRLAPPGRPRRPPSPRLPASPCGSCSTRGPLDDRFSALSLGQACQLFSRPDSAPDLPLQRHNEDEEDWLLQSPRALRSPRSGSRAEPPPAARGPARRPQQG